MKEFREPRESKVRKGMDDRFISENTSFLTVTAVDMDITNYKIYINGNIHGTATMDEKPNNGHFIRKVPGKYRLVVREENVSKQDRLESNTVEIDIKEGEHLFFTMAMQEGSLLLCTSSANKSFNSTPKGGAS